MAWQLIYTSALRTLVPGQSGYGTVARSADLREALIQRLEQLSYYQHIAGLGASTTVQSHVVSAYRILDFRGSRYHVLSRIQDAGLDFTSRTNHLAHHLVFEPAELTGVPPPAIILSQWNGWRIRWEEGPRLLEEADWGDLRTLPRGVSLPAATWQAITGDAGSAAALLVRPYAAGCNLLCQPGEEATLLNLFAESLQLLDPDCRHPVKLWEHTFTTFFQAEDSPADFLWRGCVEGTPGWQAIQRKADASLVPLGGVKAPENQLAKLAREGRPQIVVPARPGPAPAGVSPTSSPSPLRLESRSSAWRKPPVSAPPSTSHPAVRPRTVTLNFTSPRFWLPALVLLVVAAFGLPRYLKSRAGGDVRRGESPTNSLLAAGDPGSTRSGISRPSNPKRDRSKAADDQASPRLRQALRQLEAQTSAVPTWVLALDGDAAVPVKIGELEALLRKVFRDDQALTTNSIECRITVRSCEFSQTTGTIAVVTVDAYGKKLRARIPSGTGFDLNCDDWFNDRIGVQPVQFLGRRVQEEGTLTALFSPRGDAITFNRFRLIALGNTRLEPMRLSKTLLVANQDSLKASLHPDLFKWLNSIHLVDTNAQWQLRPATTNSAELLSFLVRHFGYGPPKGSELNLTAMHDKIESIISREKEKLAKLSDEMDALQRKTQTNISVGEMLTSRTDGLASLASFVKAKQRKFDRPTYAEYLKVLLREIDPKLAEFVPDANASANEATESFAKLRDALAKKEYTEKIRTKLPAGYFMNHWNQLRDLAELNRKRIELAQLVDRAENNWKLVPPDLTATPRVGLVLVTTGEKHYEVIRFTDP